MTLFKRQTPSICRLRMKPVKRSPLLSGSEWHMERAFSPDLDACKCEPSTRNHDRNSFQLSNARRTSRTAHKKPTLSSVASTAKGTGP